MKSFWFKMTSYFKIFDDQENKTVLRKAQTRKQTRSVLGEISQNPQKYPERIAKSDGCEALSENANLETTTMVAHHSQENSLSSLSINKTSQVILESRQPFAPMTVESDNETDELNSSIVSCSDASNVSSVFQDTSNGQASLLPSEDILAVTEYSKEIYQYLKKRETQQMPKWNYMQRQADITFSMRSVLVDWLVEVAGEYNLGNETIHLAVSYIDRFLSCMSVERSKLQLVGTACLMIAAKYEEIYPPGVEEFALITDNTYTNKQVLRMEHLVLKVLGFDVSTPTSHLFVNHFCQMFHMDGKVLHLAMYLNELSLLDGSTFMKFPGSVVAASSVVLARHTLGIEAWADGMAVEAGYSVDDLKECVVGLYEIFVAAPTLVQQATREKYKHYGLNKVAEVKPVDIM